MSTSDYINDLRKQIGNSLLLLPSVAAVITNEKNRILLQQKSDRQWSLPAGMIEPGETSAQAIVRETEEETGLRVEPVKLLGVFSGEDFRHTYPNGHQVEYSVVLYKCRIVEDTAVIADVETLTTQYFDKATMPPLALPYPSEVLFDEESAPYWN